MTDQIARARIGTHVSPPALQEDSVLIRRDVLRSLAASLVLPVPASLVTQASAHPSLFQAEDARPAIGYVSARLTELSHAYVQPATSSGPVQTEALALWRDITRIRRNLAMPGLLPDALVAEARAATVVGHIFAEFGDRTAAGAWLRRAQDVAGIVSPDGGSTGADLAAVAWTLLSLDTTAYLSNPALTEQRASARIPHATGQSRAMLHSLTARAIRAGDTNGYRAGDVRHHLDAAGRCAERAATPAGMSLEGYDPRHHHYVAAGVYATLGDVERSRYHKTSYLSGKAPSVMNCTLLELGDAVNVARRDGHDAAAAHASAVLNALPTARRSAPVRDRARVLLRDLEKATHRRGASQPPAAVRELRDVVTAMSRPDYLSAAAA